MTLAGFLTEYVEKNLNAYCEQPDLIREHARLEEEVLSGGYGHRQLYELVQNGADAIKEVQAIGRVEVLLTSEYLYCANEGAPITEAGLKSLLMSHLSPKRGDEIGRFGLGFKSVLGICDCPEVFSSSVSFRFNPPELAKRMRVLVSEQDKLPVLRTASLLDRKTEAAQDHHLQNLEWATTVVRLRLKSAVAERLSREMLDDFPAEFLVFSAHVCSLVLRTPDRERTIRVLEEGQEKIIQDGVESCAWRLFQTKLTKTDLPSDAHQDMDSRLQERDELPLMWAVPMDSSHRRHNRFWAFFPTQMETSLQGILNAPWKTNSDRENLLPGAFNQEMLRRAAELVVEHLPELNTTSDPAKFLDFLPAEKDAGWADKAVADRVLTLLREQKCIPQADGNYETPNLVKLRPKEASEESVSVWCDAFGDMEPRDIAHRSVDTRNRRARAERLGCEALGHIDWVKSLFAKGSAFESIAAIRLVDVLLEVEGLSQSVASALKTTAFVLTQGNQLVAPNKSRLAFAGGDAEAESEHGCLVHSDVAADPEARRILEERFGITAVSMESVFRAFLIAADQYSMNWDRFWALSRKLNVETAERVIQNVSGWSHRVKAKTLAGDYRILHEVLFPGGIVDESVEGDARSVVIDVTFHSEDRSLLESLGASDHPREVPSSHIQDGSYNNIYSEHKRWAEDEYCRQYTYQSPQSGYLTFTRLTPIAPLEPLKKLTGPAAMRMSERLMAYARQDPDWPMGHSTRRDAYPILKMPAITVWMLRRYGWITTCLGPTRCDEAIGPQLRSWRKFFPVAEISEEEANSLALITDESELKDVHWKPAMERVLEFEDDQEELAAFYSLAARSGVAPTPFLRCRRGDCWTVRPPNDITVAFDAGDAELLQRKEVTSLHAASEDDVEILIDKWNLLRAAHREIGFIPAAEAELAADRFPQLRGFVGLPADLALQQCDELWLESRSSDSGTSRDLIASSLRNGCLYFTGEKSSRWLLEQIASYFPKIISAEQLEQIAHDADENLVKDRRQRIGACDAIEEKLIEAIGMVALRAGIPTRHLQWLETEGRGSDRDFARLALAAYGTEVLKVYKDALAQNGLYPPSQWAGRRNEIDFVRRLGFPDEYAGFATSSREPYEDILGPVTLPDLHDFQDRMVTKIVSFLSQPSPGRGMLSLPTGAGKTRVAVEAIIRWLQGRHDLVSVLWIAQSDELCEQCVQSWLQAWRALGPENQSIRISRLWGNTNDKVQAPATTSSSLVVTTYQTLDNRIQRTDMDWVFSANVVVIDEAHGAIAPSYTRILRRLGLDQKNTEVPLIGLTATPFRGEVDERTTRRLALRFECHRFDRDIEEFGAGAALYSKLMADGVLAAADHALLEGEEIDLSPEELRQLTESPNWLPSSVERQLGANEARNERILGHVKRQPDDWPILLFATSVEHAEDLAVRLVMDDIPACAVTGNTQSDDVDMQSTRSKRVTFAF